MHVVDLIRKKRDGGALTDAEMAFMVAGAATNSIHITTKVVIDIEGYAL